MKKIEVMILNVIFSISITEDCGAGRDRTDDLLNAIQALSQLSYGPIYNQLRDDKNKNEISKKFDEIIDFSEKDRVFSCGSGITACVLSLAYSLVNNTYSPTVYDGSWAEYGKL